MIRIHSSFYFLSLILILSTINALEIESLAQIDQTPFGKSLLNLAQMNLNMYSESKETSLEKIANLLNDIKSQLENDQKAHDSLHSQYLINQDQSISAATSTRDSLQTQLNNKQSSLSTVQGTLAKKRSELSTAQSNLNNVNDRITKETNSHTTATNQYNKDKKDLEDAISACDQAVQKLQTLNSNSPTTMFVQLQSSMDTVKLQLQRHITAFPELVPLLDVLSQIKTNADPKLVSDAISLINKLRSALQTQLDQLNASESQRVSNYNSLLSSLNTEKDGYNKQINTLNTEIPALQQQETDLQDDIKDLTKLLGDAQNNLDTLKSDKQNAITKYNRVKGERNNELTIVNKLITHFQTKIESASQYLKNRVAVL